MPEIGMSDEVRELRGRMKDFIDNVVIKAEPELDRLAEQGYHPDTGLPLELYEAAEAKGLDTSRGVPVRATRPPGARAGRSPTCATRPRRAGCGRSGTRRRSAAVACRSWTSST